MALYRYTAIDDAGQVQRGQMDVASEVALEAVLRKQGQWLTESSERSASARNESQQGNRAVPRRVLIEFFLQLNLQLRSGVPLFEALQFGIEESTHLIFSKIQTRILDSVRAGASFSDALAQHPRTFAGFVVSLIRAGESSGRLAETCAEIRQYYEWIDRLASDVRQALMYPLFILVVTTLFFFGVFTFLIPKFAAVLVELNVALPWLTRQMLALSHTMVHHGGWVGAGLALVICFFKFAPRRIPSLARLLDRLKLALPIFGPLNHLICLSRLAQNLSTLYRAGIPLISALQYCQTLVGNRIMEEALGEVLFEVNMGQPLHGAMKNNPIFSRLMIQMVSVGESSGTLGDSLQHVATYYNEIVPRQVKKLLTVMEPVMIVGLIVLVGIVALSVFLPIAEALGGGR